MKKEGSAISYHDVAATEMSLPMEWAEAVRKLGAPIGQAREQLRRLRHGDGNLDALERALDEADRILGVLSDAEMGTTAGELQRALGFPPLWPQDDAEPPGWGEPDDEETIRRKREYAEAEEAGREVPEEEIDEVPEDELEAFRQKICGPSALRPPAAALRIGGTTHDRGPRAALRCVRPAFRIGPP